VKLSPENRAVLDDLIREAQATVIDNKGVLVSRDVNAVLVDKVTDLAGGGVEWAQGLLDSWTLAGAAKALASHRRKQRTLMPTAKGTNVVMPAWAGVTQPVGNGRIEYVQLPLDGMDEDQIKQHVEKLKKSRNTYSREITLLDDVLRIMAEKSYATAGLALADLERGAA